MKLTRNHLRRLLFKEANHIISEVSETDRLRQRYIKFLDASSEEDKKDPKHQALINFMSFVIAAIERLESQNKSS